MDVSRPLRSLLPSITAAARSRAALSIPARLTPSLTPSTTPSLSAFSTSARVARPDGSRTAPAPATTPKKQVAFAFDIDGVLKAGPHVIPCAYRALDMLDGANPRGEKVPYVLITNGGGYGEEDRARRLSNELKRKIVPSQVIQAHTVMRSLTRLFGDKPILMIGGPDYPPGASRKVMEEYGFEHVYTVQDLQAWAGASWPFATLPEDQRRAVKPADFSKISFAAVLVFHDSRDWGRDIQYICDILRSPTSTFGTVGDDTHPQIPLYFSHGDMLWGNDFTVSRFGQGAFRKALEGVYREVAGRELEATTFGKPERLTYEYADVLLKEQLLSFQGAMAQPAEPSVWMVGDNPFSDIAGANGFGWNSALVRTGVYRDVEGPPAHTPTILVDDVEQAVRLALEQEWGLVGSGNK